MHFPGKNIEINAFQSLDAAEMLLQSANADKRCCAQFAYFFNDSGCSLTRDLEGNKRALESPAERSKYNAFSIRF
jgi:hypothetical protein